MAPTIQYVPEGSPDRGRPGAISFPSPGYDQLLDVSSSFLETVQATALTNVGAVISGDVSAARIGIIAEAAQIVWLNAYIAGLTNGEGEIVLPEFFS